MNCGNCAAGPSARVSVAGTLPETPPLTGTSRRTTTLKVFGAETLPLASLAVQVTVVVPTANLEPEAGSQVTTGFGSSLSVAVGFVKLTTVPVGSVVATSMSAGTSLPRTGATVSASVPPAPAN